MFRILFRNEPGVKALLSCTKRHLLGGEGSNAPALPHPCMCMYVKRYGQSSNVKADMHTIYHVLLSHAEPVYTILVMS